MRCTECAAQADPRREAGWARGAGLATMEALPWETWCGSPVKAAQGAGVGAGWASRGAGAREARVPHFHVANSSRKQAREISKRILNKNAEAERKGGDKGTVALG